MLTIFAALVVGLVVGSSVGVVGWRRLRSRRQRLDAGDYAALAALYVIRHRLESARIRTAIRRDGAQARRELRRALDDAAGPRLLKR